MKRARGVKNPLHLIGRQAHLLQFGLLLRNALFLIDQPLDRLAVLAFVADHGWPPILMTPLGCPSRRDCLNAAGIGSCFLTYRGRAGVLQGPTSRPCSEVIIKSPSSLLSLYIYPCILIPVLIS